MKTNYLKQIERFVNGEMTEQEQKGFHEALTSDPGLGKAYLEYQRILEALKDSEELDLRFKLNEIREEAIRYDSGRKFFKEGSNWLWLAAILLVAICFTVVTRFAVEEYRYDGIFARSEKMDIVADNNRLEEELMKYGYRADELELLAPSVPGIFDRKKDILFRWQVADSINVVLEFINGRGMVIFCSDEGLRSPYLFRDNLPGGFYLLRLRNQYDAFYHGMVYLR